MTKFYLPLLMAIAIFAPGSAQRMLSLQDGVFSSELSEPTVKKPYILESSSIKKSARKTSDENQLVREDRIWKYYSDGNSFMEPENDIYVNLCFDGTTEIDDKTYYNCCVWQENKEYTDENVALIAYMREEKGDVYVRYIPEILRDFTTKGIRLLAFPVVFPAYSTDDEFDKYINEEYLLYKPVLSVGDTFYFTEDETVQDRMYEVSYQQEVECFGEYRDLWVYGGKYDKYLYNYIDGIGCIYGFLPFANTQTVFMSEYMWELMEVSDLDSNQIFSMNDSSLSVGSIDDLETVGIIYHNLQGIEVASPTTPGIYAAQRNQKTLS